MVALPERLSVAASITFRTVGSTNARYALPPEYVGTIAADVAIFPAPICVADAVAIDSVDVPPSDTEPPPPNGDEAAIVIALDASIAFVTRPDVPVVTTIPVTAGNVDVPAPALAKALEPIVSPANIGLDAVPML
jgi:hypothetical protein